MPSRRAAALALGATALLALAGCTGTTAPTATTAAADATATMAAAAATATAAAESPGAACGAAPSPTQSWLGGWSTSLPQEIRCLPHVADGSYLRQPSGSDDVPGQGNAVTIDVEPGTARAQALDLCRRVTALGYGPDGPNGVVLLQLRGDEETGSYISMPGQEPCLPRR
ncbi:hypothetical protein K353_03341 [Kitasatospora sp. SolWspMP-SS2h]|uniref:hypothetical protein n=1 Tax=Kitasatospora sp. SolWspMP-SS2h TaxID=1305729 RepID=UPI000DB97E15|nr:hypothetical protein [Kitasatospora sp. SolWspMP-SS2h]RAJ40449.1 hypothetical protein K353_03341 [Kitasatospora sp. SolWspMP-SS2h]